MSTPRVRSTRNPSLKGLKRFSIPQGVYTQHTGRLERDLLRIFRSIRAKRITKTQAIAQGNKVLELHREKMVDSTRRWFNKNRVTPVEPETMDELDHFLADKKTEWANIVRDIQ